MSNINQYLGKTLDVIIDRPLGSKHPKHGFVYLVNYGYIAGTCAPDGEEIDAYVLGTEEPLEKATGKCIAIIYRTDNNDDKLVVSVNGKDFSDDEINKLTQFQEQYFKHLIIR
jgi:inorganic pyrophosphatase